MQERNKDENLDVYAQASLAVDKAKACKEENYEDASYNRLAAILKKKFTTAIIGNIDRCEKAFGHLWGHGKDGNQLSTAQLEFRPKWEMIRTDILNHGNAQMRAALKELEMYDVVWQKYNYTINVKS